MGSNLREAREVEVMASVLDAADYILREHGQMSAMKLQKLCYYSQAWHLVWEERPLYPQAVQAWANGPVVYELYELYELYEKHRTQFTVSEISDGDADALDDDEKETVDAVLRFYGPRTAHDLSELTHREDPWRLARQQAGLKPAERGDTVITRASMAEYYDGLTTSDI